MRSLADTTDLPLRVATLLLRGEQEGRGRDHARDRGRAPAGQGGHAALQARLRGARARRRPAGARPVRGLARRHAGRAGDPRAAVAPHRPACGRCGCSSRTRRPGASAPSCTRSRSPTRRSSACRRRSSRREIEDPNGKRKPKVAPRPHLPERDDRLLPVQRVRGARRGQARLGAARVGLVDAAPRRRGRARGPADADPAGRRRAPHPHPRHLAAGRRARRVHARADRARREERRGRHARTEPFTVAP